MVRDEATRVTSDQRLYGKFPNSPKPIANLHIIIIIYLSWSWATCWPVPVSRIHKSLQSFFKGLPSTRMQFGFAGNNVSITKCSILRMFTKYLLFNDEGGAPNVGAAGLQHLPQNQNLKYTVILNVLLNLLLSRNQPLKSVENDYNKIIIYFRV